MKSSSRVFVSLCLVAACLFALLSATSALAVTYAFSNIADTTTAAPSGTFASFFQGGNTPTGPAISGSTVAFGGNYSGGEGIFTGTGSALTTIVKTGDAAPIATFNAIADDSFGISGTTVAFGACFNNSTCNDSNIGIFTGSGGTLTTIVKPGDPAPSGTFNGVTLAPAIDGSSVTFHASTVSQSGTYTSSGGSISLAIGTGGGTYALGSRPAISGGTAASQVSYGAFGPFGVVTSVGGSSTTIVTSGSAAPSGTFFAFGDGVAVSGSTAAFLGFFNGAQQGIFKGSGGSVTTIAKAGDAAPIDTLTSFGAYGFSISGANVAFSAEYGNGTFPTTAGQGIFVGSGGTLTTVIKTGDPLFGSTALQLQIGRFGLDAGGTGKLAFYYTLANGRSGVAVATPGSATGDYNGDGSVNAADYVTWRLNPAGYGGTPGGYDTWRASFGSPPGAGAFLSGAAVPEPALCEIVTAACAVAGCLGWRRRRRA